ncbi:MAG: hypothetical protein FJ288_13010 [Planctomycetes bacterium]|nr:hypothetical protein [Planctomycetota bacterium]
MKALKHAMIPAVLVVAAAAAPAALPTGEAGTSAVVPELRSSRLARAAPPPGGPAEAAAPAPEKEENPHVWKSRVASVAVFKNGLGFFLREGEVALRDGWCVAREVPPAAFGTLAVFSHAADEVVDIVGCGPGETVDFDGQDAPADDAAKRARLQESLYLKVQLTYSHKGSDRTAAGKLVSVGPQYAVLENEAGSSAYPVAAIKRMQVLELPVRAHVLGPAARPPQRVKLGMAYLRKGITWIPEYTLKVLDDDTAELTLRGTLVNEAEDLVHADVNFVVGVPHFVHTDYLAPLAVGQVIRTIGAAVAPREVMTQIANRAAIASNLQAADQFDRGPGIVERPLAAGRDVRAVLGNLPQLDTAGGADFTVYAKKDLTVRCGEKAVVTLLTRRVKFSHLYRCSPPAPPEHFFVLRNDTDTPWTTGPCLALNAAGPLSEDLLRYTPRGGRGEFPVTSAMNIAQDRSERETDRKLKAHNPSHDYWLDLVTLDGEVKVRNFEKHAADLVIAVAVPGKPVTASEGAALTLDSEKLKLVERCGTVRWTLKLNPGETRTLAYRYERYVPSQ